MRWQVRHMAVSSCRRMEEYSEPWTAWQLVHTTGSPVFGSFTSGPMGWACAVWSLWQVLQRSLWSLRSRALWTEACGAWQDRHSPFAAGGCW